MRAVRSFGAMAIIVVAAGFTRADEFTLESASERPDGLSDAVAAVLGDTGYRVVGPQRDRCEVWLAKELALKADFAPELTVKYPLTPGQFVGVLSVPKRSELTDFRGQEIEAGAYTLRYGQQPMDGNHIGTSDTADFLVALRAEDDADPAPIEDVEHLFGTSADAAGTSHPAVFSLLPTEGVDIAEAGLVHDEDHEFWVLQVVGTGANGAKVPLRLVVVGESAG